MVNTDPPETAQFADLLREYLALTETRCHHSYSERQRYFALEHEMNRRCPPLKEQS